MKPSDAIIRVKVKGRDGKEEVLNVHQGVLCQSSHFFKRASKAEWVNSRESADAVNLSEHNAETVSNYIRWLYTGEIVIDFYEANAEHSRTKRAIEAEKVFVRLAEAYVLGEEIIDVKYKNVTFEVICEAKNSSAWMLGAESVGIVYGGTPEYSPLRLFIAESIAYSAHDDSMKGEGWMDFIDTYPSEAVVDALKATVRIRGKVSKKHWDMSSFLEQE